MEMITLVESTQLEEMTHSQKMVLENVKICGCVSKNKREYPIHVLQEAMPMYEGHPVYLDHTDTTKNRKYVERVGHITAPQIKVDGIYGTLNINPHHTLAESIWYDFTNNTKKIGISQVVDAEMAGTKVVKILEVKSIDIVNNPATTYSLKESEDEIELLKSELSELRKELLSEIENVKSMSSRKAVAIAPTPTLPQSEDLSDWVHKITRTRK